MREPKVTQLILSSLLPLKSKEGKKKNCKKKNEEKQSKEEKSTKKRVSHDRRAHRLLQSIDIFICFLCLVFAIDGLIIAVVIPSVNG